MEEKVLRNTQIRNMHEMGEIKRAQELRVHGVSVQKLREIEETMQQLTSQLHQIPLGTWNQSGLQENVFGNQFSTFDSPKDHRQRIPSDDVERNREAAPLDLQPKVKTSLTSEDGQNYSTIPMPMFASRPLTASSEHLVDIPQNHVVGQQRQQIPELEFDTFPHPQSFLEWKIRFKTQVTACSDFPSVEMVGSFDEPKSSRISLRKEFSNLRDAVREDCLCSEQDHPEFPVQEEGQPRGAERKKENRFLRGRQIAFMIYDYFRVTGAHDTV